MFIGFSSVLYDQEQDLFKIWYGLHPGEGGDELSRLCYATSRDGIHWQKPLLGKVESGGSKRNNIVMPHSGVVSGVFLDQRGARSGPPLQDAAHVAGLQGSCLPLGRRL